MLTTLNWDLHMVSLLHGTITFLYMNTLTLTMMVHILYKQWKVRALCCGITSDVLWVSVQHQACAYHMLVCLFVCLLSLIVMRTAVWMINLRACVPMPSVFSICAYLRSARVLSFQWCLICDWDRFSPQNATCNGASKRDVWCECQNTTVCLMAWYGMFEWIFLHTL